ncbi:MAG: LysR family transcriptional regulator [Verrucomicrobiales bacterium]|jgi:DNA-binding transcriptional LysR family regulator|nr:LysR family transcriptional regulator [Verrucomicrobiales bacterium]
MELRELHYFIAVAEELNFSAAAKRLNLSQPPLTAAIKKLEQEFGVQLFQRTSRRVSLTEAGRHLHHSATSLLNHARQVANSTRVYGQGKKTVLRISFLILITKGILPKALYKFRKGFADVHLECQHLNMSDPGELLRNDLTDLTIGSYFEPNDMLNSKLWHSTNLIAALPENHPLAKLRKISIRELRNEPFLMSKDTAAKMTDDQLKFCRQIGNFEPQIKQYCSEILGVLALVAAGEGITIFDSTMTWIPSSGVTFVPFKETTPVMKWGAVWRRDRESPELRAFLHELDLARRDPGT